MITRNEVFGGVVWRSGMAEWNGGVGWLDRAGGIAENEGWPER